MKSGLHLSTVFLLLLLLVSGAGSAAHAGPPDAPLAPANTLLQFKAGEHLLGFQANRVYLAAADHALSVDFVGGAGRGPQAQRGAADDAASRGAPTLGSVVYAGVWPGVTVRYDAVAGGIVESTYLVAPGADVARVRLRYNVPVQLQADGSLKFQLTSTSGTLTESAPVAWQEISGVRVPVPVSFTLSAENQVGFQVRDYDARYPLTIDPVYHWHAFFGSGSVDFANAIALDSSGNVYVAGSSPATWNGDGDAPPKVSFHGGMDVVVVKLNNGGVYQWHSFYGSAGTDAAYGIAVDSADDIYLTGYSSESWGSPLHPHSGQSDIVVVKLDSTTAAVQWNTFYGSSGADFAAGIEVDTTGYLAVTGYSDASWQGDGDANPRNAYSGGYDIVILKLLASSGLYQWHAFYGSSGTDYGFGIASDDSININIYVVGSSDATWGNPLHPHRGGVDMVLLKVNKAGTFQWSTFYGSPGSDQGQGVAVDSSYNVYATGFSDGTWQGDGNTDPQRAYTGGMDIIVLKLSTMGVYQWHTFYGSDGYDTARTIAVDNGGNAHVVGTSGATWQGDGNANPAHPFSGLTDITVLRLSTNGAYSRHTFYGSSNLDIGSGIGLDASGGDYVAGTSATTWLGDASTAPKHPHSDYYDFAAIKVNYSSMYQWHTFYGSVSDDSATGIAVDADGNVYLAGWSRALWLGSTGQLPLHTYSGSYDIVVVKLDRDGAYQWHTFYGSDNSDMAQAIAVDADGNVYVTGGSYVSWQGDGATDPKHPYTAMDDEFVLKLNSDGVYQWHTFYGSDMNDDGNGIATDASGNVYVMGQSGETYQGDGGLDPKHAYSGGWDYDILKLDTNGIYQWHTFYGSTTADYAKGVAVDSSGNVYAIGDSFASWQGDSAADPLHGHSGGTDIAVIKLNQDGVYQWHTFYGSSSGDHAGNVALDASANLYIAGGSGATWQGDGDTSPLHPFSGTTEAVILKLDSNGAYQWHTFYGSGGMDRSEGIAVGRDGNVYFAGGSDYTWTGDGGEEPLHSYTGGVDLVLVKLTSDGAYRWHTFYGSTGQDMGVGVALDDLGSVYVAGSSDAAWQADAGASPLRPYSDGQDMFVLRLIDRWSVYLPAVVK